MFAHGRAGEVFLMIYWSEEGKEGSGGGYCLPSAPASKIRKTHRPALREAAAAAGGGGGGGGGGSSAGYCGGRGRGGISDRGLSARPLGHTLTHSDNDQD